MLLPPSGHVSGGTYRDDPDYPLIETPMPLMRPALIIIDPLFRFVMRDNPWLADFAGRMLVEVRPAPDEDRTLALCRAGLAQFGYSGVAGLEFHWYRRRYPGEAVGLTLQRHCWIAVDQPLDEPPETVMREVAHDSSIPAVRRRRRPSDSPIDDASTRLGPVSGPARPCGGERTERNRAH